MQRPHAVMHSTNILGQLAPPEHSQNIRHSRIWISSCIEIWIEKLIPGIDAATPPSLLCFCACHCHDPLIRVPLLSI